jgi:hypothetical protein
VAKIASELQTQMNAQANDEPIPVIVRRKGLTMHFAYFRVRPARLTLPILIL